MLAALWLAWSLLALPASARSPQVAFDVTATVACRDVTSPEFAAAHPGECLLAVALRISTLVEEGDEADLLQCLYRIESPDGALQVVDYWPKTTLETNVDGRVNVERRAEANKSFTVVANGLVQLFRVAANGEAYKRDASVERFYTLPPLELLAASGTLDRGTGVYFKLRPSPRSSLEGAKDFHLLLRAPRGWRGDYLHLFCTAATQDSPGVPFEPRLAGRAAFVIGMYRIGDELAQVLAHELFRAEHELRQLAHRRQREIEKRALPTLAHKVGAAFSVVDPKIPDSWVDRLIYHAEFPDVERLPEDVRRAATRYAELKSRLRYLRAEGTGP